MPTHHLTSKGKEDTAKEDICLFAQTNFRNQLRRFGIKTDDRRRHMYVIGKTGMGKTTMLENMVLQDIYNGHGIGVVDPHGDFAEKIINYIPANRINDVVYINPADVEYPVGFNILEVENEEQKHLVAAGLMAVFKKIWPDVWSARMEYILNNTLLALLDYEGSTLLGINRLLADKKFRSKVLRKLKDPVIKSFWTTEFANYEPRYQKEAVAPIQNKIGQFLSASVIRNMVAQVKSTINVREIMDSNKILIMNLSKGRIGEDNSRLLGGMLITEIQLAAMSRVDMLEEDRKDFFLYVDEFQNFATPSFANILSEARKYRLSLIMAHQYVMQLDEVVADAVFGNVGSMVTFRVGAGDAEMLEKEYSPTFLIEDIVNLPKFQIFLKLMIDGVASQPFSAVTMPPIGSATGSAEKVIKVSRERYGKNRNVIEDKITRWSGMEVDDEDEDNNINDNGKNKGGSEPKRDKNGGNEHSGKQKEQKPEKAKKPEFISNNRGQKEESSKKKEISNIQISKPDVKEENTAKPVVHLTDLLPPEDAVMEEKNHLTVESTEKPSAKKEEVSEKRDKHVNSERRSKDKVNIEKKKRKRKRNRKKKSGGEGGEVNRHDTEKESKPEPVKLQKQEENNFVQPEKQEESTTPRKIKPDEVISFDQKDDDDAWRSDK